MILTAFIVYIVVAGVLTIMTEQFYVIPWFNKDKILVVSPPISSFLWPIGFVLTLTNGLFGLFKTDRIDKE